MGLFEGVSRRVKTYPYKERVPYGGGLLIILLWGLFHHWPVKFPELIGFLALSIIVFLHWRDRTFWFLWGIVIGVVLAEWLSGTPVPFR